MKKHLLDVAEELYDPRKGQDDKMATIFRMIVYKDKKLKI